MEVTSSREEAQLVNTAVAFSTSLPIPQGQENGLLKEKKKHSKGHTTHSVTASLYSSACHTFFSNKISYIYIGGFTPFYKQRNIDIK